jgi:hypothetical protein
MQLQQLEAPTDEALRLHGTRPRPVPPNPDAVRQQVRARLAQMADEGQDVPDVPSPAGHSHSQAVRGISRCDPLSLSASTSCPQFPTFLSHFMLKQTACASSLYNCMDNEDLQQVVPCSAPHALRVNAPAEIEAAGQSNSALLCLCPSNTAFGLGFLPSHGINSANCCWSQ